MFSDNVDKTHYALSGILPAAVIGLIARIYRVNEAFDLRVKSKSPRTPLDPMRAFQLILFKAVCLCRILLIKFQFQYLS